MKEGAMKRLTFVFTVLVVSFSAAILPLRAQGQFPNRPNGWVYDEVGALTGQQVDQLNAEGKNLQRVSGISLVLAVVNHCGSNPAQYGTDLFNYWGVGNSQTDLGYMVLMCWGDGVKGPGRTVVSVPGKGLEAAWPKDVRSQIVGLYIKPALGQDKAADNILRGGDLGRALVSTYEEYARRMTPVSQPPSVPVQQPVPVQTVLQQNTGDWTIIGITLNMWVWIAIFVVLGLIGLMILSAILSAMFGGGTSTVDDGPVGGTTIVNNSSTNDGFLTGLIVGENLGGHHHHEEGGWSAPSAPSYSPPTSHDDSSPFGGGSTFGGSDSSSFGGGSSSAGSSSSDNV